MQFLDRYGKKGGCLAWLVFLTGIAYYCFAYLLRVYPNVMKDALMSHYSVTSTGFGILASAYYFAYAPMQLPVGVSVDKIGPRRSLLFACITACCGVLLFATSTHYGLAFLGRFLVGLGASFGYVTALKLASVWLPHRWFASATGLLTGGGMIAAIFTEIKLTQLFEHHGFHATLYAPIYTGLFLFILIFLFIRNCPVDSEKSDDAAEDVHAVSYRQLGDYLKLIVKNPQMWLIGLVGCLLYLPASVFLDLWAIPYLEVAHQFTPQQAATGVSLMLGGWIISSFLSGFLSDLFKNRKLFLMGAAVLATIVSAILLYTPYLSHHMTLILLFLFGMACGPHPLCFSLSKENCAHRISGTAVAFANFLIMLGGFFFQPIVGKALELQWDGTVQHGIHMYTATEYTYSLSILPIGLLTAVLLILYIKDTYHHAADV